MGRRQSFLLWLLLLTAVGAGWWWGGRTSDPPPDPASIPTSVSIDSATITVHVAGWVASPGLVDLPPDSRVAAAIASAGGALPGALVESINLAEQAVDGMQIVVPGPEEAKVLSDDPGDGRIHLNRATAAELDALPGIGPVIAERIVAYRVENGPFTTVEDLLDVPGIGEAKLQSLRDLVAIP